MCVYLSGAGGAMWKGCAGGAGAGAEGGGAFHANSIFDNGDSGDAYATPDDRRHSFRHSCQLAVYKQWYEKIYDDSCRVQRSKSY